MKKIKLPTGIFEYDPTQPLGKRGGFGQVFAGRTAAGNEVAIKKLHVSADDAAHRELRIAEELKGRALKHVIPFIDSGEDADTGDYFLVMPKADESLQAAVESGGIMNATAAAVVLLEIVKGLNEVADLVHRDLKPDNVLRHENGWKVADLGIARFVEEATASNTLKECLSPYYAAPEQWRFERATHATDVYALGCIGFFLLTGKPPFVEKPELEHQKQPLPHFSCADGRLQALINNMVRKLPETRPALSRIEGLLAEIVAKPQLSTSDPLSALATVGAQVAEKEQQVQAKQAAEQSAREARLNIAKAAFEILSDSAERLWGKIHAQVPNAHRNPGRGQSVFECRLGDAREAGHVRGVLGAPDTLKKRINRKSVVRSVNRRPFGGTCRYPSGSVVSNLSVSGIATVANAGNTFAWSTPYRIRLPAISPAKSRASFCGRPKLKASFSGVRISTVLTPGLPMRSTWRSSPKWLPASSCRG